METLQVDSTSYVYYTRVVGGINTYHTHITPPQYHDVTSSSSSLYIYIIYIIYCFSFSFSYSLQLYYRGGGQQQIKKERRLSPYSLTTLIDVIQALHSAQVSGAWYGPRLHWNLWWFSNSPSSCCILQLIFVVLITLNIFISLCVKHL